MISNEKPSAIFRIGQKSSMTTMDLSGVAQLGLSIEPMQSVIAQLEAAGLWKSPEMGALVKPGADCVQGVSVAQRILENFYNYVTSFAMSLPSSDGNQFIPVKTLEEWYRNIQRKLKNDGSI